jgi:drug/metabolite transporter (DMT)-like permease
VNPICAWSEANAARDTAAATQASQASPARVWAALAAVYVVWGSTYLAIRVTVRTLPPLLSASARFLIAGALLYWWASRRGWWHERAGDGEPAGGGGARVV